MLRILSTNLTLYQHYTIGFTETASSASEQNAIAWRCFTFSKEAVHAAMKIAPYADMIAQLAAPSVINHMMPASYDGQVSQMGWKTGLELKRKLSFQTVLLLLRF